MDKACFARPERKYLCTSNLIHYLREYAGMNVSKSTIYRWSMNNSIPCKKAPNGRLLFPVQDIVEWIEGTAHKKTMEG